MVSNALTVSHLLADRRLIIEFQEIKPLKMPELADWKALQARAERLETNTIRFEMSPAFLENFLRIAGAACPLVGFCVVVPDQPIRRTLLANLVAHQFVLLSQVKPAVNDHRMRPAVSLLIVRGETAL